MESSIDPIEILKIDVFEDKEAQSTREVFQVVKSPPCTKIGLDSLIEIGRIITYPSKRNHFIPIIPSFLSFVNSLLVILQFFTTEYHAKLFSCNYWVKFYSPLIIRIATLSPSFSC